MSILTLQEQYGSNITGLGYKKSYSGELEFEVRNSKTGMIIDSWREKNLVKIYAKEIFSHRILHSKIWDVNANTGAGGWVTHDIDIDEFALKYIVFGASFDENHVPLGNLDTRYYSVDTVTNSSVPIRLGVGAEYDGGLINAIPISEPGRPLKRIERVYFEASYQPAGVPLLQDDVRALNNILVLETTLTKDEYNGFGVTASDYFTISEVALVGAAEVDSLGACELDPRDIFLTANADGTALLANANGTATINLDPSESLIDLIKEGDTIKIVEYNTTAAADSILDQVSPYYLVVSKTLGGRDITLDRTPVDSTNTALSGDIGIYRDGFKIFSHRILKTPIIKSDDFIIICRWRIICN